MNIAIIINAYTTLDKELNQPSRIKEELAKLGVESDLIKNGNFSCEIVEGAVLNKLSHYDGIVYLDKDKHFSAMLEKSGMRLFNKHQAIATCDDKMCTHIALSNLSIPMPKTLSAPLCYTPTASISSNYLDMIEEKLDYPLIIKQCYGSLGKGVYLIENRQQLFDKATELISTPHLYQEFIESSRGKDLRVIVIGGKVVATMLRTNNIDFRSNIELGGIGTLYSPNREIIDLVEKVATCLELDYCGIDVLFGNNQAPLICEVNSNAFFGGIEKVCNINIAKLYAQHIVNNLK